LLFARLVVITATATPLVSNMLTREQLAFQLLRLMISHDWKFDVSEKDWDTQAVERAYRIADLFIKEGEITNVYNQ
jgi:hypothetical protein